MCVKLMIAFTFKPWNREYGHWQAASNIVGPMILLYEIQAVPGQAGGGSFL